MEGEGARAEVQSWASQEGGVSEGSSVQLAPLTWLRLIPFRSRRDTEALLLAILPQFVDTVDVEKPGLVEELMAAQVVTPRDAQSLSGTHRPTSTEKARRLWEIFMDIDYKRFVKKVLPCLCKYYWYIIPEKFWLPGNAPDTPHLSYLKASGSGDSGGSTECVRCAIRRRIRPPQLGDFLVSARLISRKFHATISKGYRTSDTDWRRIFRSFKRLKGQKMRRPVRDMRRMLISHSLSVPGDLLLRHLMIQGFPCTCPARRQRRRCILLCVKSPCSSQSSLPSYRSAAASSGRDSFPGCSLSDHYHSSQSISSHSDIPDPGSSDSHRLTSDFGQTSVNQVLADPCSPLTYGGGKERHGEEEECVWDYAETTLKQKEDECLGDYDETTLKQKEDECLGDYDETTLKQVVSIGTMNRCSSTDSHIHGAEAVLYSDEEMQVMEEEEALISEENPPVSVSPDEEETQRKLLEELYDTEMYDLLMSIIRQRGQLANDGETQFPTNDSRQVHTPERAERGGSYQPIMENPFPNTPPWASPPSQDQAACSSSSKATGPWARASGPWENSAFEAPSQAEMALFQTEKGAAASTVEMPWPDPGDTEGRTSLAESDIVEDCLGLCPCFPTACNDGVQPDVPENGSFPKMRALSVRRVLALVAFCVLLASPLVLLFVGLWTQDYGFCMAAMGLFMLLLVLSVVIRRMKRWTCHRY